MIAEAIALARVLDGERLHASLRRAAVTSGPAEEHTAATVVESVLSWLTAPASESAAGPTVVVGTLPEEQHRLGARLVAASAAF